MKTSDHDIAVAAIERRNDQRTLRLALPGGETQSWQLPVDASGSQLQQQVREFIKACEDLPVACYHADGLTKLLSDGSLLSLARDLLGNLRNLRTLALIFMPTETHHLADGSETTQQAAPEHALAQNKALYGRVLEAISSAPPNLLAVLKPLLAGESTFSWLQWPKGTGQQPETALNSVLPRRVPSRRRLTPDEAAPEDIAQTTMEMLSPGGLLDRMHPAYEHRPGQVDMGREVAEAFCNDQYLLVEAGTGVGKSVAYLIPAILWSRREGQPVVISTNTKNLQQQLIAQDIPMLREGFSVQFEAALLKGRANYACIRRLALLATDAANSLVAEDRLAAAYLLSWIAHSSTGDVTQIPQIAFDSLSGLEHAVSRSRSEAGACLGRECSYYAGCPVQIARAHARNADIIVSNHALTLEDTKGQILPEYTRLIFDEAHNVESVATESLSLECSSFGVRRLQRMLAEQPSGFIAKMSARLDQCPDQADLQDIANTLKQIEPAVEQFSESAQAFGEHLHDMCSATATDWGGSGSRATTRLTDDVRETDLWQTVATVGKDAAAKGAQLLGFIERLTELLGELDKDTARRLQGLDADAEAIRTHIADQLEALKAVLGKQPEGIKFVTWAEAWTSRWGISWAVNAAPVDVGPVLDQALYQHKDAIVFTSATMTVSERFDYFRQRLGLDEHHDRVVEAAVPSPFDLTEQLLLCIPADIPEAGSGDYADAVIEALRQICEAADGGTLALFTARTRMSRAFETLRDDLRAMGLTPLCQDLSGERSQLLERLKADPSAVLFGLKSFWEGVDVPGEALRCVVICKLPFAVPTDPIIEARQEDVARKGLDPMNDYYMPEAIIGFKQGFGRLIRSTTDTGVVFVLDRRLLTKWYGRRFFQSIQRCELAREPLEGCVARAAGWLGNM